MSKYSLRYFGLFHASHLHFNFPEISSKQMRNNTLAASWEDFQLWLPTKKTNINSTWKCHTDLLKSNSPISKQRLQSSGLLILASRSSWMCLPGISHLLSSSCYHGQKAPTFSRATWQRVSASSLEPHEMFKDALGSHLTPSHSAPSQASVSSFARSSFQGSLSQCQGLQWYPSAEQD